VRWIVPDIADAVAEGLSCVSRQIEAEQAVSGLDALDEVQLHPLICKSLRDAGYGVHPEQRYPGDRRRRKRSEGERCDIVLTPENRALAEPDAEATLFTPENVVDLSDAFWLEVKTVTQFDETGPNPSYTTDLGGPLRRDVMKLARDTRILHAGLLILFFASERAVIEHDIQVWQEGCVQRLLPILVPTIRYVEVGDRLGQRVLGVVVYPVGSVD